MRTTSDVPIVMLTARADGADRVRGLEIGADDYLSKPFEPRELLLRLNNIIRRNAPAAPASGDAGVRAVRTVRLTASNAASCGRAKR